MIRILGRASRARRKWLQKYIRPTPVGWIQVLLEHGFPHYRGRITNLGQAKTIFQRSKTDHSKQLVHECARTFVWRKHHKDKIRRYTGMLKRGENLEVVVTVVRHRKGDIIVDGNHRAISSYRAGKRSLEVDLIDLRYPKECSCQSQKSQQSRPRPKRRPSAPGAAARSRPTRSRVPIPISARSS